MLVFKALCECAIRMRARFGELLLLTLLFGPAAGGQVLGPARDSFDVWEAEDNAGQQNPITAILQSTLGYLWLGTYHGLIRFDGVRSVVFEK